MGWKVSVFDSLWCCSYQRWAFLIARWRRIWGKVRIFDRGVWFYWFRRNIFQVGDTKDGDIGGWSFTLESETTRNRPKSSPLAGLRNYLHTRCVQSYWLRGAARGSRGFQKASWLARIFTRPSDETAQLTCDRIASLPKQPFCDCQGCRPARARPLSAVGVPAAHAD